MILVFAARSSAEISVRVSTDQTSYVLGEPILITVTAVNSSDEPVRLGFADTIQSHYVLDNSFTPTFLTDGGFTYATVPANGSFDWEHYHRWSEYPLSLGLHEVIGSIVDMRPYRVSDPVSFEIVGPDPVVDDVFIDFQSFPDGTPVRLPDGRLTTAFSSQAFAAWGVNFYSSARLGFYDFRELGTNQVLHTWSVTSPSNIIALFDMPVFAVSANVGADDGQTVTMSTFDAAGNLLGTATSDPTIDYPHLVGPLEFVSPSPIATVKWTASDPLSTLRIDNLSLDVVAVPEPATILLTIVVAGASLLCARPWCRKRRSLD